MTKAKENGNTSEVLRRWGIHASDITRIRSSVEQRAIDTFKARKSRKPKITIEQHEKLKSEKGRLEATVIEHLEGKTKIVLRKRFDAMGNATLPLVPVRDTQQTSFPARLPHRATWTIIPLLPKYKIETWLLSRKKMQRLFPDARVIYFALSLVAYR